jgi:class 3 adenylate cyclase
VPNPPTGTVTFLFTDIEGSTKLWERSPEAMSEALARHDKILRETIEIHGGHVFKTVGDAFFAAFSTATDALEAGLESQRKLFSSEWGQTGPLRVRMALHTGAAEERDGDAPAGASLRRGYLWYITACSSGRGRLAARVRDAAQPFLS